MADQSTLSTNYPVEIDRKRYRRAMRFFRRAGFNIVWWEIILKRLRGEAFVAEGREERTRRYAREFREVAIKLGGVMIKLGQFLSARVDVMPDSLIAELAGLQDEVPPVDTTIMMQVLEEELGQPKNAVFSHIDDEPVAAASLGQVYRGKLLNGDRVAIKILRPGIEVTVASDMMALRKVAKWVMYWKLIAKRADVPALLEEFERILWDELDYRTEADNAERFQHMYYENIEVYIPEIYRDFSTSSVLVMEDVTAIKLNDVKALKEAGVDPSVVARRMMDTYLQQFFRFGFFHADPHPGNLFVYPLPETAERQMYGRRGARHPGRAFYLVFIDFGMCGTITRQRREGLREAVIAVGTRDVERMLNSLQTLEILLPSEYDEELKSAAQESLDFMWGKSPQELAYMDTSEYEHLVKKYRKMLYDLPFQVPQDFLYVGRASGILSGVCTELDENFDPWDMAASSARKLLTREMLSSGEAISTTLTFVGEALRRQRGA